MKQQWKTYTFFIALSELVGLVAGFLTREGTKLYGETIIKPLFSPPAILFPIVWTILYALMGVGAARVWLSPPSAGRSRSIIIFILQLAVNFFWSILFFNLQWFGGAFVWLVLLWVLIAAMIIAFAKADQLAAYLQIPYLLWVTFAGYLNYAVWLLN